MSSREQPCFPDFCIANKHYFQCVHQVPGVLRSHLCRGRFPLDVYRDLTWLSYIYQLLLYRVFLRAFSQSASSFYMAISSQNSQPIKKLNNDVIIMARLGQRLNVRGACVGKFRKRREQQISCGCMGESPTFQIYFLYLIRYSLSEQKNILGPII